MQSMDGKTISFVLSDLMSDKLSYNTVMQIVNILNEYVSRGSAVENNSVSYDKVQFIEKLNETNEKNMKEIERLNKEVQSLSYHLEQSKQRIRDIISNNELDDDGER